MSTIAERVAAGVAWLDQHEPDWVQRMDLNRLVLSSPCRCVLGQLYGDYADRPDLDETEAIDHGFNAGRSDVGTEYEEFDALEAEWRRVITERRAAA